MAIALLLALLLVTAGTLYLFAAHPWWFPAGASGYAPAVDHEFHTAFWLLGGLFIAAQIVLLVLLLRSWRRNKSSYYPGNWRMELAWTSAVAALFFWFHFSGGQVWSGMRLHQPDSGVMKVEVTGLQFAWYFRYTGADNKFGSTRPELEDASLGGLSALGVDPNDPTSKDDVVSGILELPVNTEIDLTLRSQDVIHSFFVPAMRFKQDAVPGLMIHMHFRPEQTGDYEIACAELCGLGHYKMHGIMRVVSEQDFQKWLAAREADKQ